jgi:hypothetical protein
MRSQPHRNVQDNSAVSWPSPQRIYLAFLSAHSGQFADPSAVLVPVDHLRHPALRQPDAALLGDLASHHPPVRGLLVLLRADVEEVLSSLNRSWADLGVDWDAVASSVLQGPQEALITVHGLEPDQRALLGPSPHLVRDPDGSVRELDRAARERWRAALVADLWQLLSRRP